jgi:hypothetical protein
LTPSPPSKRTVTARISNAGKEALWFDRADIGGSVYLCGFDATGRVRLTGAKIGDQLDCSGATFNNAGGLALFFDGAEVGGSVFLRDGFEAAGAVRFFGARIGGSVECDGGTFSNAGKGALWFDRADIGGSVYLRDGFDATGMVRLTGAKIGSQLDCSRGTFRNAGDDALAFDGAAINGEVFLRSQFRADGVVRFPGAKIGGQLNCSGATVSNEGGYALLAQYAVVGGGFFFVGSEVKGGVNLYRASVGTHDDDVGMLPAINPTGSWVYVDPLDLEGFAYGRFGLEERLWDSKSRERWLQHTSGFQHGAWQQLIEVYRAAGRDGQASQAAIALQNDRLRRGNLSPLRKAGRWCLRVLIGHGYRPWLAGIWALAIIAAFALVVWHWPEMFVPKNAKTGDPEPVAYAASTFLPIVELVHTSDWTPTGWVRWVDWSLILSGWALTTIFVAGFTGIVRTE